MKRKKIFFLFLGILIMLSSCGPMIKEGDVIRPPTKEEKNEIAYMTTRIAFNHYYKAYLDFRDTITDPVKKQELVEKYSFRFQKASSVLDSWSKVIADPGSLPQEFNTQLDTILLDLINAGILKIE